MDLSETEIKSKVLKGLFWKILENGGAQGIQFVIAIILARLLSPAEYGLVSIIMIFITIANVVEMCIRDRVTGKATYGVGISSNITRASIRGIFSAVKDVYKRQGECGFFRL